MKEILRKLSSRKLWMALAGVATGLALVLGADGAEIDAIAGAITAVVSAVSYIIVEGKIDAESVKNAAESVQDVIDLVAKDEK